ncbi:MAG TPA: transaminase [Candidatus Deferrimicrobium sp.]|nr:transaminase [Candidatus Deferrimicrobium sp.]
MTTSSTVDRDRLAQLTSAELDRFARAHPRSGRLHEQAKASLLDGVPMNWMTEWASPFPLFVEAASGAGFRCVDGHDYVDFCLGDTGAMAGHGPAPTIAAVERQMRRGITHMLPTADAIAAGEELGRRFGLPLWQFTMTATDANRFAIRLARRITGRSKILVHDHCYHGSVDETLATLDPVGRVVATELNIGPPIDPALTSRVVPFNDIDALERALADEAVAAVLVEPALTNVGIVLPEPGYHDALRDLTRRTGSVLIIDETHTICAGPGGMTARDGLEPDMLVIGKTIGGGIPAGTYGMTLAIAERIRAARSAADPSLASPIWMRAVVVPARPTSGQPPTSAATTSSNTAVWRSTSAAVVTGLISAMLWNGVISTPRFIAARWRYRSSSWSAWAICSAPSRGGVGVKWYSARAPRRVTCHGTPCARMTSSTPASQRSARGIIRANASSVRTSPRVARIAARDRA